MPDPKLTVRPPPELHERLQRRAALEHRSVHGQILVYIERGLEQDEAKSGSEEER